MLSVWRLREIWCCSNLVLYKRREQCGLRPFSQVETGTPSFWLISLKIPIVIQMLRMVSALRWTMFNCWRELLVGDQNELRRGFCRPWSQRNQQICPPRSCLHLRRICWRNQNSLRSDKRGRICGWWKAQPLNCKSSDDILWREMLCLQQSRINVCSKWYLLF